MASYQSGNFNGVGFADNNLIRWNFAGATLSSTDLRRTDARGATGMSYTQSTERQNFIRPDGKVEGFALASWQTMRIWDYQAATPLTIGVQQSFSMSGNSTLRMVFEDSTWGSLMQMEGMISVTLAGTLELGLADGVTPFSIGGMGTTFRLFDWSGASSVSGQFSQILMTGDYQWYSWDTSQLYTLGTITLVPEPGTFLLAGFGAALLALHARANHRRRKNSARE